MPVAERLHRHTALHWAAEICVRHGLTLRIYGDGWERHPEFAAYARPALAHGDELRRAYAGAGASLHISPHSNAHQRVAECALSGGLMVRRGPSPDMGLVRLAIVAELLGAHEPERVWEDGTRWYTLPGGVGPDRADADRVRRMYGAPPMYPLDPGDASESATGFRVTPGDAARAVRLAGTVALESVPDYAFDRADESMFWRPVDLERVLLRAARDGAWRARTVEAHRRAALGGMTYDAALRRVVSFVSDGLAARGSVGA